MPMDPRARAEVHREIESFMRGPKINSVLQYSGIGQTRTRVPLLETFPSHPVDGEEFHMYNEDIDQVTRYVYVKSQDQWYPLLGASPVVHVSRNVQGPWAVNTSVEIYHGYRVLIVVDGVSAYTSSAPILSAIPFEWDNVEVGRTHLFQNQNGVHMTYPGQSMLLGNVTPGTHTFRVEAVVNGTSDANDFCNFHVYDWPGSD